MKHPILRLVLVTTIAVTSLPAQDFWQSASTGLTEPTERVITVNQAGTIFTGSATGAFRSTNHGTSWEYLAQTGDQTVQALWIDRSQRLYGGTEHGVFVSTDDGDTWTHLNNGFPDTLVLTITTDENDHVFAGTDLGGLFRSTDLGAHWTKLTAGLTSDNMTVLVSLGGGLLLAGTDGQGIYRSTNDGDSWAPADSGLADSTIYAMVRRPDGSLYVGTNLGGVFRSTDAGLSWTGANNGLTNNTVVSFVSHPDGGLYAGTVGGGVFRSTDGGGLWTAVNAGLGDLNIYTMAVDSGRYVFAGTANGDFRSILPLTSVGDAPARPLSYALGQNYPNPFNPTTRISFDLAHASVVTLRLYNTLGAVVATLVDGERREAGRHELGVAAGDLPSGIYFYRLAAVPEEGAALDRTPFVSVRKMALVK